MAHLLLSGHYFAEQFSKKLQQSGKLFLATGAFEMLRVGIVFFGRMTQGELKLSYDANLMIPLFLGIIGLFFLIQSETLLVAKGYKDENELTI